jgi:hypothetical protein
MYELNNRIIRKNIVYKNFPHLVEVRNNIFTYETEEGYIFYIDHNSMSVTIHENCKETYFTFDSLGKFHGLRCINNYGTNEIFMERYNHGIPHGEWSYDKPCDYWVKNYDNGVLHGPFTQRYGKHKVEGTYKLGKFHGIMTYYSSHNFDFIETKKEVYDNGVLKETKVHNI